MASNIYGKTVKDVGPLKSLCTIMLSTATLLSAIWSVDVAEAGGVIPQQSVVIVEAADLYDSPDQTGPSIGTIGAVQQVAVDRDMESRTFDNPAQTGSWIRVQTWLGPRWIEDNNDVRYGTFSEEQRQITLLNTVPLYDRPEGTSQNGAMIGAQTLHVTGVIAYNPKFTGTARSFLQNSGKMYRVQTWLGEKWIMNPVLLENMRQVAQDYDMKLTGNETAYSQPYETEGQGEPIPAGVVHVTAFGWEGLPWTPQWYAIDWKGQTRWITLKQEALPYYRLMDSSITIKTDTRCSIRLKGYEEGCTIVAGTYKAVEGSGKWVRLQTAEGLKWVDLQMLLEHPSDIALTEEEIELDANTESYYFPIDGGLFHAKGYFSPRKVKAVAKWIAPDGAQWYNLYGSENAEWVRISRT